MPHGKIFLVNRYSRDMLRRSPATLFVFGDNVKRIGLGGQAAEARGEPNAVGIVTKIAPSTYMTDDHWDVAKPLVVAAFTRLADHLVTGSNVAWPTDGVGTGLAELPQRAPGIYAAIERCRDYLFLNVASQVVHSNS